MTTDSEQALQQGSGAWLSFGLAGVIGGLLAVIFSISHASLITGSAAPQAMSAVVGMALIGSSVIGVTAALFGRIRGAVAMTQDVPAAALGSLLVALTATLAARGETLTVAEIAALNFAATLMFAVTLFAFGQLRLSMIMRYAPRPVLAGFLAGTGFYVMLGALGICLGEAVTLASLRGFGEPVARDKLLFALAVVIALEGAGRMLPTPLAIGGVMAASVALFQVVTSQSGIGSDQLLQHGWVIAVPEGGLTWPPVPLDDLARVELSLVASQIVPLSVFVVLSVTAVLMMIAAVEAATRSNFDLDSEMRVVGAGNAISALLGGAAGYLGLSPTMAARRIAPGHRVVSLLAGLLALAVFLSGNLILGALPLPVFAGFLLWVGADFLKDYLFKECRRTTAIGAALTLAIFIVMAVFGLFEGAIFGLVAGSLLFVVDYSQHPPVRSTLFGGAYHGAKEYSPAELRVLQRHGDEVAILKMQGYLFFGTANRIRDEVRDLVTRQGVRRLVLDLEGVTSLDSTAVASFKRISEDLTDHGVMACLTGIGPVVAKVFARSGLVTGGGTPFLVAEDLEGGLSRFLLEILQREIGQRAEGARTIAALLVEILQDDALAARIAGFLDRVEAKPGEVVLAEGEAATDIYIVESGLLAVSIGTGDRQRRLRTTGPGSIIGELSYYAGGLRTSDVTALEPSVLWRFSAQSAERVLTEDPQVSSRFHAALAGMLAQRVIANTRLIRMLRD